MTTAPLPEPIGEKLGLDDLVVGSTPLSIDHIHTVARGKRRVTLDPSRSFSSRIAAARETVEQHLQERRSVYGVTTGVGASVTNHVPSELRAAMPNNLFRFHGCGTGAILGEDEAAAVVLIRLASLARGHSGVRFELLARLSELLDLRLLPRIPSEGSVGASGDLTPLSYLAAAVAGDAKSRCAARSWRLAPRTSAAI